jgi:uncharacterized membrane protein
MVGVRLNPVTRVLMGVIVLVAGLLVHVTALLIAGAVLGLLGLLSLVSGAADRTARDGESDRLHGR